MEPEEKFNKNVLYVLKQIKERLLHAGKGGNTWYSVNYNIIVASDRVPSVEDEVSILKRLQEWGAIVIRLQEFPAGENYTEKFLLKILQPKFDEIYQEYNNKTDNQNIKIKTFWKKVASPKRKTKFIPNLFWKFIIPILVLVIGYIILYRLKILK